MKLEVLQNEMVSALKTKDRFRKDTIADLIGVIQKATITANGRIGVTEELVNTVLLKEKKTTQEMIDTCPESRVELLEAYKKRMAIVNEFAPSIMSDPVEIGNFIDSLGIEINKANRGKIMSALKGKCDMKIANEILSKRM